MSLRKDYEQALSNQTRALDQHDVTLVGLVRQTVEAITRDGDFNARVADVTENGYQLHVQSGLARVGRTVCLGFDDVARAYDSNEGYEEAAVNDLVETVISRLAGQQAEVNRNIARKQLLLG